MTKTFFMYITLAWRLFRVYSLRKIKFWLWEEIFDIHHTCMASLLYEFFDVYRNMTSKKKSFDIHYTLMASLLYKFFDVNTNLKHKKTFFYIRWICMTSLFVWFCWWACKVALRVNFLTFITLKRLLLCANPLMYISNWKPD